MTVLPSRPSLPPSSSKSLPDGSRVEGCYYVLPEKGAGFYNPVAIKPEIYSNRILWQDTARGSQRIGQVQLIPEPPKNFDPNYIPEKIISTSEKGTVVFQRLTAALYNSDVKQQTPGKPNLNTDEAVQDYFMDTVFS